MTCFQVLFVSERTVIGVGYDCNPMVFAADERGVWYVKIQIFVFLRFGRCPINAAGPTYFEFSFHVEEKLVFWFCINFPSFVVFFPLGVLSGILESGRQYHLDQDMAHR